MAESHELRAIARKDIGHTALHLITLYVVAVFWFLGFPSGLWDDYLRNTMIGEYLIRAWHLKPGLGVMNHQTGLVFVVLCATVHTMLVLIAFALSARVKQAYPECRSHMFMLALALGCFFRTAQHGVRYCFEHKLGWFYQFGSIFWEDAHAESYSLMAATTMSMWVGVAFLVPVLDPDGQTQRRGLLPATFSRYAPHMILVYILSFAFFRFVANFLAGANWPVNARLPGGVHFYANPSRPAGTEYMIGNERFYQIICEFASFTHASALALGVILCAVTNRLLARVLPSAQVDTPASVVSRNMFQDFAVLAFLTIVFYRVLTLLITEDVLDLSSMEFSGKVRGMFGVPATLNVVMYLSYSGCFAVGVLIEQVWQGSSTNKFYRPGYTHILADWFTRPFTTFEQFAWQTVVFTLCLAAWHWASQFVPTRKRLHAEM
eukprot:TRINITY_DN22620_c0_g1_i1.p1 TRINITY_DN22620_c0_g1~~TRINITY_DN22620_c0_g1_i1.p1  ORF type:complete len:434 (+),score=19.63 TRINITY_DN22620_c0_g1_i1:188-1489(+)